MTGGSIYKIQFPNGKHYIGLTTTSLRQRQNEHKYFAKSGKHDNLVYRAINKYDIVDTFELIEIDTADTLEELCEKEIGYIVKYNSHYIDGFGYNMTYGGEGTNGYVYTKEDKLKMSEMCKKYWESPEARKEHSEKRKKYFENNPEAGKEQGERVKKYYEENPEARQQISEKSTKQWENTEAREQMSEIKKKYYENPEAIKKCSEAQKKRFENPEENKKNSERLKKYYQENPEAKQKNSERLKKYYQENPEAKQKNSERVKKHHEENPEWIKKKMDTMGKNKPFDVFKKDGTFIKTFTYQFEAKEYLQKEYHITSIISMGEVLSGNRNSSAGFVFKYRE